MSELSNKIVADLREQLAAMQAEMEHQRARAEAAEQEEARLAEIIRDVTAMLAKAQELLS